MHHKPFTTFIASLWDDLPPLMTIWDLVNLSEQFSPSVG